MAKVIFNDLIPFKGYKAIAILPFIYVRNYVRSFTEQNERHETIHLHQQLEVLLLSLVVFIGLKVLVDISWWWLCVVPLVYFVLYGLEWLIRLLTCFDGDLAYHNISHEQEAYLHEAEKDYLKDRWPFGWVKYVFKRSFKRDINGKIVRR